MEGLKLYHVEYYTFKADWKRVPLLTNEIGQKDFGRALSVLTNVAKVTRHLDTVYRIVDDDDNVYGLPTCYRDLSNLK